MEFLKGTEEMVAVTHYHCSPFLWHHYCIRQQLGHCTVYLYHLLTGEVSSMVWLRGLVKPQLQNNTCPQ
jgi:hypothetical protein